LVRFAGLAEVADVGAALFVSTVILGGSVPAFHELANALRIEAQFSHPIICQAIVKVMILCNGSPSGVWNMHSPSKWIPSKVTAGNATDETRPKGKRCRAV
jgi:thiol:disulfide interchange protein